MLKTRAIVSLVSVASAVLPGYAAESSLVYVSPIKSNGELSSCQAEVWFVANGADYYVVTDATAWRARAPGAGLPTAQVWVGDVGQWKRSGGKYKKLPGMVTDASIVRDERLHEVILADFGRKYSSEWPTWGKRFKDGLANGSRVMLKYSPRTTG